VARSESRALQGREASATIIDVIYKGSVTDGTDDLGLFGLAGANWAGHAFVATFEMDTSKGIPLFGATENYIRGGSLHGVSSPMMRATLEVNGKKADVGTGLSDSVQSFLGQSGIANQQSHEASCASNSILLDVIDASLAPVGVIPFTVDIPLTFDFDSSVIGGGEAFFNEGAITTSLSLRPTQLIYQYPPSHRTAPARSRVMTLLALAGLRHVGLRKRALHQAGT
jgi:hypothetical protein